MVKQPAQKTSPFDALKIAQVGKSQPTKPSTIQTATQLDSQTSEQPGINRVLAKSTDPNFTKFTTYVRKQTHLAVKTRLVSQGRELSDLVEDLLSDWLHRETVG